MTEPTMDREQAVKLYSVDGATEEDAKRLRRQAIRSGWNATMSKPDSNGRYSVRVWTRRGPHDPEPSS